MKQTKLKTTKQCEAKKRKTTRNKHQTQVRINLGTDAAAQMKFKMDLGGSGVKVQERNIMKPRQFQVVPKTDKLNTPDSL